MAQPVLAYNIHQLFLNSLLTDDIFELHVNLKIAQLLNGSIECENEINVKIAIE